MKLIIASLLASAAAAVAGLAPTDSATTSEASCQPCPAIADCAIIEDCDATVECLPDGTCRVECENDDGESCWAIVRCDESGNCEIIESQGDCRRQCDSLAEASRVDPACESSSDSCVPEDTGNRVQVCGESCD